MNTFQSDETCYSSLASQPLLYFEKEGLVIQQLVSVRIRKNGRFECSVKSCGYFPLEKKQRGCEYFLKRKDLFVCLTTEFGKSACYTEFF